MEGIANVVVDLTLVAGGPLLIGLFLLEGFVVGKVLQPPAVFVSVVAIVRPSVAYLVALSVGCAAATVLGQWLLVWQLSERERSWPRVDALPARIGEERLRVIDRLFVRYGGIGIFLATFVPLVRATIAVPAGLSSYSANRFALVTALANLLYFPLLIAVALGTVELIAG